MTVRDTGDNKLIAALTDTFQSWRDIHHSLDQWSPTTVRHRLKKLADEGRIERGYNPHPNGKVMVFRRRTDADPA